MNTEQQLRERAAAILKPLATSAIAYEEEGLMIYFNDAANAMIDFHKQELQRIGEVYVPIKILKLFDDFLSENFYSFNPHIGKYFKTSEEKPIFYSFETVYQEFEKEKLSLLEVKDVTDK